MQRRGLEALQAFFESSVVARKATGPLSRDAEVTLFLDGGVIARFTMESGIPRILTGAARAPDFVLTLPEGAVTHLTGLRSEDVGELGVEFFKLVLSQDPARKVRIQIGSSATRLLSHGYFGVLAQGGVKVTWWLFKNGVKNPKAALERFRRGTSRRH